MTSKKSTGPLCQSCAYPLTATDRGSETDGTLSDDYCSGCYQEGEFTEPEITMKEMIEKNVPTTAETLNISIDEARVYLKSLMPTLKRWQ
ncbi:MAG: zinc ribbon domain-containing protein [Promethearchaeota archaeon]